MEHRPERCFSGAEYFAEYTGQCSGCPMFELAKQGSRLLPKPARVAILKRSSALRLDHPERPVGMCGLIWDLQHKQSWAY
jgi:hypothetical protein